MDNAAYCDMKAELPGVDFGLSDQDREPMSLNNTTKSEFVEIDDLNDLAEESTQNADDFDVSSNTTSLHETVNSNKTFIKPTLDMNDSTDYEQTMHQQINSQWMTPLKTSLDPHTSNQCDCR